MHAAQMEVISRPINVRTYKYIYMNIFVECQNAAGIFFVHNIHLDMRFFVYLFNSTFVCLCSIIMDWNAVDCYVSYSHLLDDAFFFIPKTRITLFSSHRVDICVYVGIYRKKEREEENRESLLHQKISSFVSSIFIELAMMLCVERHKCDIIFDHNCLIIVIFALRIQTIFTVFFFLLF